MSDGSSDSVARSRRLRERARIALVSPAGPLGGEHELERAVANVRSFGWDVSVGGSASARDGYFAGGDAARLADLVDALEADDIDAIWCLRGGYGAMRLLPHLDIELIARAGKPIIGFSDITALHSLWQRAGVQSFHGPTARAALTQFSRDAFVAALQGHDEIVHRAEKATTLRGGSATGVLAGGNLAILAALCGTPYQFDFRQAIVVIEDVGEAVYRIDRMLVQLRLAGAFDGCVAVAFGQFTNCQERTGDEDGGGRRALQDVLQETADALRVPVLSGIPIGHIDDQWTIPLGARATLDTTASTLTIHRQDHLHTHNA